MHRCRLKTIGFVLLIMTILVFPLGGSKEYLKGAIIVDKMNSQGEIEAVTFHFKDFPYDVTTRCNLSSKNVDHLYGGPTQSPTRSVYQSNGYWNEEISVGDRDSPFATEIQEYPHTIARSDYINKLVNFCRASYIQFNELARENKTTAITFYPRSIDGKICTVLEYTGSMSTDVGIKYNEWDFETTNVVGLFMPLNETKEGCDRYLILCSGNQTADWLDSVNVSKRK